MSYISQKELESYLWGAAVLLRGVIDSSEYKNIIFPLMFLKRISDVYDEEFQKALIESDGDAEYAALEEMHRFQIPDGAHWNNIRKTSTNVGKAIADAMFAIEKTNPDMLGGIFGDNSWTNKERLNDAILNDLIEHFSKIALTTENVPHDQFGNAYEYLIKQFADDSGHTAAEFYTNRTVVELMTQLTDPKAGESIYDPTCGTGGMLLNAMHRVAKMGGDARTLGLYGQEVNLITSAIARMNMFIHGVEDFEVVRGDTLKEPKLLENDQLMKFDVILANPPYSIKKWDRVQWQQDPFARNIYGTPPQGNADYAFFQHIVASLKDHSGRCAILFPHGVLTRNGEAIMRQNMIEDDIIEGIIGLGENLFYNSAMESCIVLCNKNKRAELKNKVFLIDAKNEIRNEKNQSFLDEEHIQKVLNTYTNLIEEEHFSHLATLDEIRLNRYSLNLKMYIENDNYTDHTVLETSLEHYLENLQESRKSVSVSMDQLMKTLEEVVSHG